MTSSSVLNQAGEQVVRQPLGPRQASGSRGRSLPDVAERAVDVCVIGGGPAGLAAATTCARAGAKTMLVDDQLAPRGSLRADPASVATTAEARTRDALDANVEVFGALDRDRLLPEDDGGVLAVASPAQLVRVHARAWIWPRWHAVNSVPDNDRPA